MNYDFMNKLNFKGLRGDDEFISVVNEVLKRGINSWADLNTAKGRVIQELIGKIDTAFEKDAENEST